MPWTKPVTPCGWRRGGSAAGFDLYLRKPAKPPLETEPTQCRPTTCVNLCVGTIVLFWC